MEELINFIEDICDEMISLKPDWEDCSTCGPVIPYLRANKSSTAITQLKLRVRSLMRELKLISLEKYNTYNKRFRSLRV